MLIDPKAAKVRGVAKLTKKDARSSTGLFLLEGTQGLRELLGRPKLAVEVFATEDAMQRHSELFERSHAARIPVTEVSASVLKALSDTQTPQGIIAVCQQFDVSLQALLDANQDLNLIAVLSNIRDPGNAGTILRAADAAGADAVIFTSESVDIYNPKVVRSTAGSLFHLPVAQGVELSLAITELRNRGLQIFAADATGTPVTDLGPERLAEPTAWLFGNEAWGFRPEQLALADQVVSLPIYGSAESLNLATAASVCLYASAFAQNA